MVELQVEKQTALWTGLCGVFLLVCGIGSAGTGFAWISYHLLGGHGLWSGIFLIVPGILGMVVWAKRNKGVMIGFLTMCIIAAIISTVQAIITGNAHSKYSSLLTCPYNWYSYYAKSSACRIWRAYLACLLSITIFNGFGAVLALAGSILGCVSVCNQEQPATVVVTHPSAIMSVSTTHHGAYVGPMGYQQQPIAMQQQGGYGQHPGGYGQQPGGYPQQLGNFQQEPPPSAGPTQQGPLPQYSDKQFTQAYN